MLPFSLGTPPENAICTGALGIALLWQKKKVFIVYLLSDMIKQVKYAPVPRYKAALKQREAVSLTGSDLGRMENLLPRRWLPGCSLNHYPL